MLLLAMFQVQVLSYANMHSIHSTTLKAIYIY